MLPLEYYFVASRFVNKIKILNRYVVGLVFCVFIYAVAIRILFAFCVYNIK